MLPLGSILLAGVPATGKSSFGNWLEANKGCFHLDFDEEDIVEERGFGRAQQLFWQEGQADALWEGFVERRQPIILTWGFAPHFLPKVRHLLTWGFTPVWFTANHTVARHAFLLRGSIEVKYFDQYMDMLAPLEQEILAVFGDHVIQPLHDDGTRQSFEEIYERITPWLVSKARHTPR